MIYADHGLPLCITEPCALPRSLQCRVVPLRVATCPNWTRTIRSSILHRRTRARLWTGRSLIASVASNERAVNQHPFQPWASLYCKA